jgi:hypothetical protein
MWASPVKNPWARIVSPETERQITVLIETSTGSIPQNGVLEIIDVALRTFDDPEPVLQKFSPSISKLLRCRMYSLRASGMDGDHQ